MSRSRRRRRLLLSLLSAAVWGATGLIPAPAQASGGCSVSAPLTQQLMQIQHNGQPFRPFVSFSAANVYGTLGGIASDGFGNFELLRYDLGISRLIILDRMSFNPWDQFGSVRAIGVDNAGDITFRVYYLGGAAPSVQAIKYASGSGKYVLTHPSTWSYWTPESVGADGTVYGWAHDGSTSRIVRWTGAGAGTLSYVTAAGPFDGGYVLGNAAVAFDTSGSPTVRMPDGAVVSLGGNGSLGLGLAAGPFVWGITNTGSGVALKWQVSTSDSWASVIPAQAVSQLGYVTAAGPDGTAVGNPAGSKWPPDQGPRLLLRPGIPVHQLPAQLIEAVDPPSEAPVAVTHSGSVVYTGTDGLARVFTCTS